MEKKEWEEWEKRKAWQNEWEAKFISARPFHYTFSGSIYKPQLLKKVLH